MRLHREVKNHSLEQHHYVNRLAFASVVVFVCLGLLLARFLYLQIFKYDYYQTLAESNRISLVPTVPNRGLILDRNGAVLAHNFFVYTLEVTPSKAGKVDDVVNRISQLIEVSAEDKKRFKKLRAQGHDFESVPIRTHLNEIEAAKFAANRYQFPGVEIRSRLFRHYPMGNLGVHMIGHIGRINQGDVKVLEDSGDISNYKGSDHIGKGGIEQYYERSLHGKTGFQQVEIDAGGEAVRVLANTPPVPGDNLILSVDAKMQEIAETAFGNRRGALVAMDPKTGEVLSYVSMPTFDPNLFVDGIDADTWKTLNGSLDRPLINRPIRGIYPPGSTFKPFVAMAGLEEGKRRPPFSISDPGFYALSGSAHRYRDWKPEGHGSVDMQKAIQASAAGKKAKKEVEESSKPLLEKIQNTLGERVKEVRVTHRLTDSPACLVAGENELSGNLARMLKAAGHQAPEMKPTLEVNPEHALVKRLQAESEQGKFDDLAQLLFDQALLAEGGQLEDPASFVKRMNSLLA